jgi:alanine or glycine:cation symporter, AGCS family
MDITALAETAIKPVVSALSSVLFYDVGGFPFIVLWLMVAALFFTLYLRGVNLRLLGHSFHLITSKNTEDKGKGEVSQLQAFLSAISATVGLGSIAGVSVAVAVGGPGAIFWIIVMGIFSMATKFAEVTLSLMYRKVDVDGKVLGGPIHYLQDGLKELGYAPC